MKRSTAVITVLATALLGSSPAGATNFTGLPDHSKTPGAINSAVTQANIKTTICVPGWTKTVRPPASYTNKLKLAQLKSGYALAGSVKPTAYEEDHLIPLEIGGNPTSALNLWPEPWTGAFGAHIKDKLENAVHKAICNGSMTLTAGRAIFSGDWETGYAKIFGALPAAAVAAPSQSPSATGMASPTPTSSSSSAAIHPGSYCTIDGATGMSATGVVYTCKTSPTDSRLRWRQ